MAAHRAAQNVLSTFAAKAELPSYVCTFFDRHGKQRWRFRRRGVHGYFSDRPGTKVFEREYEDYMAGFVPDKKPRRATSRCSVYFIAARNAIKIGYAKDPQGRLRDMQVGQPFKLGMMATVPGGVELEREYHKLFAEHRLRGEWFADHPDILNEVRRLRKGETPLPYLPPSPNL